MRPVSLMMASFMQPSTNSGSAQDSRMELIRGLSHLLLLGQELTEEGSDSDIMQLHAKD